MRRPTFRALIVPGLLLLSMAAPQATTIVPLPFDDVVDSAGIIVEGTVTDMQVRTTGAALLPEPETAAPASPTAPVGAPVEGGRTLFTEVTLQVERQIGGSPASEIRFILAGGTTATETAVVFGMPRFEIGSRYVLMLRPDYEHTNVPVVGVSQGYFRVVEDPANGQEILLTADGDIVLAIEGERLATSHNPARLDRRTPRLAAPPEPGEGSEVRARTRPSVERYWASRETPIRPGDFLDAVREMKEVTP